MEDNSLTLVQTSHLGSANKQNNPSKVIEERIFDKCREQTAIMPQSTGDNGPLANGSVVLETQPAVHETTPDYLPKLESPTTPTPKHVAFELLLDESSKMRARIPMRVQIFPHDTTDSIVTTVKNFYGIYETTASGVSFEDQDGITLIARYENLRNNMTVYVRVIPKHHYPDHYSQRPYYDVPTMDGYTRPSLGEPFEVDGPRPAQTLDHGRPLSRPNSRVARVQSVSPARGRRSVSKQKSSRAGLKSRGSSVHGSFNEDIGVSMSDSEGGHGSITGSKKAKSDHFGSSDISMENILQDGRRKRPKFDSSELPLFAPPQVPRTTSTSSVSPQRRSGAVFEASPFARPSQHPFRGYPLPSPQGFGNHEKLYALNNGIATPYATPTGPQHGHRLRNRNNSNPAVNSAYNNGVLPTPDPTIASCISDEDVAMQLIRLGDASNFSHGRTSTSTVDDAFSGVADASSTGATSDGSEASGDEEGFAHGGRYHRDSSVPLGMKKHKTLDEILPSCESSDLNSDGIDDYRQGRDHGAIKDEEDDDPLYQEHMNRIKRAKNRASNAATVRSSSAKQANGTKTSRTSKSKSVSNNRKGKISNGKLAPPPPPSTSHLPPPNKAQGASVNFQHQLAPDEEDLSTKPRCQRCRKSKKGCDRQRPCQRCKDAGIGIEGCVSEDEGNGRKGRYGRHMGVPVKKDLLEHDGDLDAPVPKGIPAVPLFAATAPDKNKKRKR